MFLSNDGDVRRVIVDDGNHGMSGFVTVINLVMAADYSIDRRSKCFLGFDELIVNDVKDNGPDQMACRDNVGLKKA